MNKQWRLIAGFALLGLLVTAVIVVCIKFSAVDLNLVISFVILCPPSLLSIQFSEVMRDKVGFYAIWLFELFMDRESCAEQLLNPQRPPTKVTGSSEASRIS